MGCGIRIAKRMVLFSYTVLKTWTHWVGYLNEVQLWQWLRRSLDLQISSLVGSLKETNAFLVHLICAIETVTIKGVYIIINIIFLLRKRVVFNRCLAAWYTFCCSGQAVYPFTAIKKSSRSSSFFYLFIYFVNFHSILSLFLSVFFYVQLPCVAWEVIK